jgi:hypothetical protein
VRNGYALGPTQPGKQLRSRNSCRPLLVEGLFVLPEIVFSFAANQN